MLKKSLISVLFLLICFTGCANPDLPFSKRAAEQPPVTGKPLGRFERQRLECESRLGKNGGVVVEARDFITVVFGCDTLFEKDSVRINGYVKALDDLAGILKEFSETRIRIDAHTDSLRSEEANLVQSEARAWAIKGALVEKGVESSRIVARGWGESKPLESNATEAGRHANRRLTVTLMP